MSSREWGGAHRWVGSVYMRLAAALLLSVLVTLVAVKPAHAEMFTGKCGTCDWSFDQDSGVLTIGAGTLRSNDRESYSYWPWFQFASETTEIRIVGDVVATQKASYMFNSCSLLTSLDLSGLDTSQVTDMTGMFAGDTSLSSLNVSTWDTSSVKNMSDMFKECSSLATIDLSSWDTANVTEMQSMFSECSSLTAPAIEGWDVSNVSSIASMFYNCASLSSLDLSEWDTSNLEDMCYAFENCTALSAINLSGWETSKVETANELFLGCSSLTSLDLSSWDTPSLWIANGMFSGCSSLASIDVSSWDTSSVSFLNDMFAGCSSLVSVDLSNWDNSRVMDTSGMFSGCSSLASLDLSKWNTGGLSNMSGMFYGCSELASVCLSDWDTSNVSNMSKLFSGCSSLSSLDLTNWNTSGVSDMSEMFSGCSSLESILISDAWSTEGINESASMFEGCTSLVGGNGTTFSAEHIDAEYARSDSEEAPGYLTLVGHLHDISYATVTLSKDGYTYTGGSIQPEFTVELGGKELVPYQDFQYVYDDPQDAFQENVGTYTITLEGCEDYWGTITFEWSIVPACIDDWEIYLGRDSWAYTGKPITPKNGYIFHTKQYEDGSTVMDYILYYSSGNFDLAWENNILPGTATVIVTGKRNLTGSFRSTFKIDPIDVSTSAVEKSLSSLSADYTGELIRPTATVKYEGEELVEGTDYTLEYSNPEMINAGRYYVWINGMGRFGGRARLEFVIHPKKVAYDDVEVTFPQDSYDIKTIKTEAKPQVTVNGELIPEVNSDNGKTAYTYTFGTVSKPGKVNVSVRLNSNWDESCNYYLEPAKIVQVLATGNVSDAKVTAEDAVYAGKPVTPKVRVSYDGMKLVEGTDFEITGCSGNDAPGTATATIKGIGYYAGETTVSFRVYGEPFFEDVKPDDVINHGAEVEWMGRTGISEGWKNTDGEYEFRGTKPVVRCDFAAFLYRLADLSDDGERNDSPKLSDEEVAATLANVSDCTPKTSHAPEIAWMIKTGISKGWPDKGKTTVSFRPMAQVARQDMAAFLYRYADIQDDRVQNQSLKPGHESVTFRDVTHGDTANHSDEVEWLASVGVTKGWGPMADGTYEFRGTKTVARQDMAAFMYRLNAYME